MAIQTFSKTQASIGLTAALLLVTACGAQAVDTNTGVADDAALSSNRSLGGGAVLQTEVIDTSVSPDGATTLSNEMAAEEALDQSGSGTLADVALSPSGQHVAAATTSGLYLYRADTLEQLWFGVSDTPLRCLAWSPDGRYLITGGHNGNTYLWQAADGTRLQTLTTTARGTSCPIAWSPDGQRVVDGRVIWNTSTWQVEREFYSVGVGSRWEFTAIASSPDGLRTAIASMSGYMTIHDAASMALSMRFWCATLVYSLSWSPDGKALAVASGGYMSVGVWDAQSGKIIKHIPAGQSKVAWSPDGGTLAVLSYNLNQVLLFSTANWTQTQSLDLPFKSVHLSWSPDGQRLLTAGADGTITLVPLDKATASVAAPPVVCKMSGAEVYLVVGEERRHIIDWDTFLALGYEQGQIVPCDAMANYPTGAPITRLLKGGDERVYWMEDGLRHHIPDMETFLSLGFQTGDISVVPDAVLNLWSLGEPLPSTKP